MTLTLMQLNGAIKGVSLNEQLSFRHLYSFDTLIQIQITMYIFKVNMNRVLGLRSFRKQDRGFPQSIVMKTCLCWCR